MIVIEREREIRDREMEAGPPLEERTRERGNRVNLRKLRLGVTKLLRPPLELIRWPRRGDKFERLRRDVAGVHFRTA